MSNIQSDVKNLSSKSIEAIADISLDKSKEKARIVAFKNEMERGIYKDKKSDNVKIISKTLQGHRFEEGYSGSEEITPLLVEWAEHVKTKLPATGKLRVDYKSTAYRPDTYQFMRKSIPTDSEIRSAVDRVIKSTLRGGTVYG